MKWTLPFFTETLTDSIPEKTTGAQKRELTKVIAGCSATIAPDFQAYEKGNMHLPLLLGHIGAQWAYFSRAYERITGAPATQAAGGAASGG
jgi:hypothetical protein